MNMEEKREYLKGYQRLQNKIVGLTYEIEKWKGLGEKVNSAINGTGSSGGTNSSKVECSAVNISDIVTDIQKGIDSAKKQRDDLITTINERSPKMRHREILEMHFINGMSIAKIAKILKKEERTVANAISVAINQLDI